MHRREEWKEGLTATWPEPRIRGALAYARAFLVR